MVDALLVFSPLQEFCFFVLRAPHLDQMGVTPLLRRRLFGLQRFCFRIVFAGFSKYVSSLRLLPLRDCTFCLTAIFTIHLQVSLPLTLRFAHQFLFQRIALRRSVPTIRAFVLTI